MVDSDPVGAGLAKGNKYEQVTGAIYNKGYNFSCIISIVSEKKLATSLIHL